MISALFVFWFFPHLAQLMDPTMEQPTEHAVSPLVLEVRVERLNGVGVDTPVMLLTEVIGAVAAVDEIQDAGRDESVYSIKLNISGDKRFLVKEGSVAVVGSALLPASSRPQVVIQLFVPPGADKPIRDRARLRGYNTLEDFWSKGFKG